MEYKKITVVLTPYNETAAEVMMAQMGEVGFESFCDTEDGFEGYIPTSLFERDSMNVLLTMVEGVTYTWSEEVIPDQDWNKEWEQNYFKPILVDDKCLIRSTFHEKIADTEYEIIINPQMSFGTGHHETTCLMMSFIMEHNISGAQVLDMGCGTGILAILALKCGAAHALGVDIDEWCYRNTLDNISLNAVTEMEVQQGGADILTTEPTYDLVLANINRNILLADMERYVMAMKPGATLMMSGFYQSDKELIEQKALSLGLEKRGEKQQNNWTAMSFYKHN